MDSEKVKEIKKIADFCIKRGANCGYCTKEKVTDTMLTCRPLMKELLTLINELESENERQKQSNKNLLFVNEQVIKQNTELKDRIAELENGVAKSMLGCEFLPECTNEKLNQFATLLKIKTILTPIGWCVSIKDIDKVLKEFLK
ncbi:MAG: hypothetical protein IKU15_00225 [Clostridia bacterium]|nr:hypothetical protein [Clostridia bacterium]